MSLEKIKEVKQLSSTNEYVGAPIGCDAENVDLADGSNLEEKLDDIDTNIESVNNEVKEIQDSIQIDGVTITRDDATKVIALAKTLQDKIASVDSKINATNIANNLTTTEANFVLDARQGKTLQDQITSLNNDLSSKISNPTLEHLNVIEKITYSDVDNWQCVFPKYIVKKDCILIVDGILRISTNIPYDGFNGCDAFINDMWTHLVANDRGMIMIPVHWSGLMISGSTFGIYIYTDKRYTYVVEASPNGDTRYQCCNFTEFPLGK